MERRATMLILTREDVRRALPMAAAMDAVERAFAQLSAGRAEVPLRPHVAVPEADGLLLVMPAYLAESGALAVKALTLFPHNAERHALPAIAALVTLFDATNGVPLALLDGGYLTALRTGAASGVATRHLARQDARTLALFGAGAQALPQAWAACVARPIARILLVNRTRAHAERLATELRAFGDPIPADVRIAASAREALAEADVICTATASSVPLFADGDLRPGAHINAIGAYRPDTRELAGATVARARVVVDARAAAWAEAGELVLTRDEGLIGADHIVAELGEIALGHAAGRTDAEQITLFKSVGNAVQDAATAQAAYARARALGLGTAVEL
jgi:alanine dehydrogenase